MKSAVITIPLAHFDVELFGQELIEFHAAPGLPGFLVWSVFKHPSAVLSDVTQITSETVHVHRLAVQVAGNFVSLTPECADQIASLISEASPSPGFRQFVFQALPHFIA
nr:hypothetical protein [Enterobacter roggenkampii]MDN3750933.1 hypothetical protein [Enterobacter roggenkampii]MDN3760044.1 hypothetical protein [Enterobacter roggenkampii]MDN3770490.1 hypothetical protein [Enterobacter roggenkampii]